MDGENWIVADPELTRRIDALLAENQKLEAIKLYREHYPNSELKEALEAVEARAAGQPLRHRADPRSAGTALGFDIDTLIRAGNRIQAIKRLRDLEPGLGLKEAKDRIDARAAELGVASKSGCLIATAAYGTSLAPEVEALRRFRDRRLAVSATGRGLIRLYERFSPPAAALLTRSPRGRAWTRFLLRPLVRACRRLMRDA